MDLTPFLKNLGKQDVDFDAPLTEEELAELKRERHRHAPKHGPQKVRWITAGQQRRAAARWEKTRARKANRRFRRQWMANEAAFNRLLSQIGLLERTPESGLAKGVEKVLVERYGSVEAAREHLGVLIQERVAAAQQRAAAS